MTRYEVETVMAFESETYGSEKRLAQIELKSEGLSKRTVNDVHIMQVDIGRKKLGMTHLAHYTFSAESVCSSASLEH